MWTGVVLLCLAALTEARLSSEQAELLADELQDNLGQIPRLLDLYRADVMHKLTVNTLDAEHLRVIDHILTGIKLKGVRLNRDLSDDIKAALSTWQSQVLDLETHEDIKEQIFKLLDDIADDLEADPIEHVQILMDNFVDHWEAKMEEEKFLRLPDVIVRLVLSEEYAQAAALSLQITQNSTMRYILRRIYDHNQVNFHLAMTFIEKIEDVPKTFLSLSTINHELTLNDQKAHVDRFLSIFEQIEKRVENTKWYQTADSDFKLRAMKLKETVKKVIYVKSSKSLKAALLRSEKPTAKTKALCKKIHDVSHDMYIDILSRVTSMVWDKVSTFKLLDFVSSQATADQTVHGLFVVLGKMSDTKDLRALLKIGWIMKKTLEYPTALQLTDYHRDLLLRMKVNLEESIHNAIFADKVCVRNVDRDMYLNGNNLGSFGEWTVVWGDSMVKLRKSGSGKSLCATRERGMVYNSTRPVLEGGRNCEEEWWVEPLTDGACLIRNIKFNEYLFAAETGVVGTRLGGSKPPGSKWRLELCKKDDVQVELANYTATYEKIMSRTGEKDVWRLLVNLWRVQKFLQSNYQNPDQTFLSNIETLIDRIRTAVIEESTKSIEHALLVEETPTDKIKELCKHIYDFSQPFFMHIIDNVTDSMFNKIPTIKLLEFVSKLGYDAQNIDGLAIVLTKMTSAKNMTALLKVGKIIEEFLQNPNMIVQHFSYDLLMQMKTDLGESIHNVALADTVCAKNVGREMYLDGSMVSKNQTQWEVLWAENAVKLRRFGSENVLCATRERRLLHNHTRPVLEGGRNCEEEWWVEPLPDGACLIRSIKFNEYLFAGDTGEVGTELSGTEPSNSTWRLETCQEDDTLFQIQEDLRYYTEIYENIMSQRGTKNIANLIDILQAKLLQRMQKMYISSEHTTNGKLKTSVETFITSVRDAVVAEGVRAMKDSLEERTRKTYEETKTACQKVHEYSSSLYIMILNKVIGETFDKVPTIKLLEFVSAQFYTEQVLHGLHSVLHKMREVGDMTALLKVGEILKNTVRINYYFRFTANNKHLATQIKMELGESIHYAVFAGNVCIRNVELEGYLNGSMVGNRTEWGVVWGENALKLRRRGFDKGLCVTGLVHNSTRPVLEGGRNCEEEWWVEPLPEGACLIRNIKFNEYLFAADTGEVGTRLDGTQPPGSAWRLELCQKDDVREQLQNYTAMYRDIMRRDGDKNIIELIDILRRVPKLYGSRLLNTNRAFQSSLEEFIRRVWEAVVAESTTLIKKALKSDERDATGAREVCKLVYNIGPKLYREILSKVTKETFERKSNIRLLNFLLKQTYLRQELVGLRIALRAMYTLGDMSAMLRVAEFIKEANQNPHFVQLSSMDKGFVMRVKAGLGESIRNAVYADAVCASNIGRGGYLNGSVLGNKTEWEVVWGENAVKLRRRGFEKWLGVSGLVHNSTRPVLEGGRNCEEEWWVEPLPDGACLIRNIKFNEYLFAAETGEVGTRLNGTQPPGSAWRLQPCQQIYL